MKPVLVLVVAAAATTLLLLHSDGLGNYNNLKQRYLPGSHKDLWPLDGNDAAVLAICALSLLVAAAGGIGGGGLFVPVLIAVGKFKTSRAVALSNVMILGGGLANFVYNVRRRRSKQDRPIIDWDLILMMEPMTVLGAVFGSYFNRMLMSWLTDGLLAVLLSLISYRQVCCWNLRHLPVAYCQPFSID